MRSALRRRRVWAVGALVALAVGGGAAAAVLATRGSSAGTWFRPGSPRLEVSVAGGCPRSVAGYADVANTFPGPPLVPANPTGGLVCRYGAGVGLGPDGGGQALLMGGTRLDAAQAQRLAGAIRQIHLTASVGVVMCPADLGSVAVIGLTYAGRADVGLWYRTSGCQTLDNGRIGAFEVGNPSFYTGFEGAIDHLSPPVAPADAWADASQSAVTAPATAHALTAARTAINAPFSHLRRRNRAGSAVHARATRKPRTTGRRSALRTSTAIVRPTSEPQTSTSTAARSTAPT